MIFRLVAEVDLLRHDEPGVQWGRVIRLVASFPGTDGGAAGEKLMPWFMSVLNGKEVIQAQDDLPGDWRIIRVIRFLA